MDIQYEYSGIPPFDRNAGNHAHMADNYSRIENGFLQPVPTPDFESRENDVLFAQGGWEGVWDSRRCSSMNKAVRRRRSRGFSGSDSSTDASRRSSFEFIASHDISTAVISESLITPLPWKMSNMSSPGALEIPRTPPEGGMNPFGSTKLKDSLAEELRPPSPRNQISRFQGRGDAEDFTSMGPLERYLAQAHEFTNLVDETGITEEDWRRLRILRARVLRGHAHLRFQRKELRGKQNTKSSADEAFMKYIRVRHSTQSSEAVITSQPANAVLGALFAALQTARDEYGSAEFDFNALEDTLDEEEFELAQLEGRIYYAKPQDNSELIVKGAPVDISPSPVSESFTGISSTMSQQYHPIHVRYLSRLGDLDLARERHQNMIQERQNLLEMRDSRTPLGIELPASETEFLKHFPEHEAALKGEILAIQIDVEQWRAKCLTEGIDIAESIDGDSLNSPQDGSKMTFLSPPKEEDEFLLESLPSPPNVEPSTFSVLLPKSIKEIQKLSGLITDFVEGNKSDRINRWIRHQLQTSHSAVRLLFRISFKPLKMLDIYEWQICVLH